MESKAEKYLENLIVDGKIIRKWVFKEGGGRAWTEFI
jgi:hypothetical protein